MALKWSYFLKPVYDKFKKIWKTRAVIIEIDKNSVLLENALRRKPLTENPDNRAGGKCRRV